MVGEGGEADKMNFQHLSGLYRKLLAVAVTFSVSLAWAQSPPQAQISSFSEARDQALSRYFSGKPVAAIVELRQAVRKLDRESEPDLVTDAYMMILDMCVDVRDGLCLLEITTDLRDAPPRPLSKVEKHRVAWSGIASFQFGVGLLDKNVDVIEKVGPSSFDPVTNPLLYIEASFRAASILVEKGRLVAARLWLDAGLSVLLAHGQFGDYKLAVNLLRAIKLLNDTEQFARSSYYWSIAEPYLRTVIAPKSIYALQFHYEMFRAAEQNGLSNLVEMSARQGIQLLEELDLPEYLANWYRDNFVLSAAATCAIEEKFACAEYFLAAHSLAGGKKPLLDKSGRMESLRAGEFILATALTHGFQGKQPPAEWRGAIEDFASASDKDPTQRAYATWVAALYEQMDQPGEKKANPRFLEAARLRLLAIENTKGGIANWHWLPNIYDRVILGMAAITIAGLPRPTESEREIAAQAIDVGNRTARQLGVNALGAMASMKDPQQHSQVQALSQLIVRFASWEKSRLRELLAADGKARNDPEAFKQNGKRRLNFVDFVTRIGAAASALPARATNIVPKVPEIQRLLDSDEVLVSRAAFAGMAGFVCLRNNRIAVAATERNSPDDIGKLETDSRLLRNALTEDTAPSPQLDAQFPFPSVARLYRFLFAPVASNCVRPGEHVIWVDASHSTFPVHALSANTPPGQDGSYDLSKARWLGREYAFSYVVSLHHFAGGRYRAHQTDLATAYLGIGNPVLSARGPDGTTFGEKIAARSARSATAGLVSLSALPETETEIRELAKVFPNSRAKVLLGPDATEAKFRGQLLSEYGVIHFATHGLISEELPGLTEPALVLTPSTERSTADDGLLTASKVSQLPLRARLIVLSACNTANFSVATFGNEFQGLSTAFLMAGAPSMMLTLWPVDSTASEVIVRQAVSDAAASGSTVAKALSNSLFKLAEETANPAYYHPRFWAPFVIFGDGAVRLKQVEHTSPARPRLEIQTFDQFREGGEFTSILSVPGTPDLIVSGFADKENGRFKAIVQRIGPTGDVRWTRWRADIGSGSAVLWNDSILASGFDYETNGWRGVLTRYTLDGHPIWERRLDADTFVMAMAPRGEEMNVVALPGAWETSAKSQVRLFRVNSDGTVRKVITLLLKGRLPIVPNRAIVKVEGATTTVWISSFFLDSFLDSDKDRFRLDPYSVRRDCGLRKITLRVTVSNETDEVLDRQPLSGIDARAFSQLDSTGYIGGSFEVGCMNMARAVIAATPDIRDPVYEGPPGFSTFISTISATSRGALIGLGFARLQVNALESSTQAGVGLEVASFANTQTDELRPWFIVRVDPKSRVSSAYPFGTGSDLRLASSTMFDDGIVAAGSLGGHPVLLRVTLPEP